MTLWTTVLLASGLAFALKFLGYVVPHQVLDGVIVSRVTAMLPVALLSALVVVQTFTIPGGALTLDARAAGLAVAVTALLLVFLDRRLHSRRIADLPTAQLPPDRRARFTFFWLDAQRWEGIDFEIAVAAER